MVTSPVQRNTFKESTMKSRFIPLLLALGLLAAPAWSAPARPATTTVQSILAKPIDKAVVTFKATVVEDQGKNKFLVEDAGRRLEVKAGPDWHHSVSLPLRQPLSFTGEVHVKDKDGERKLKVELYRVSRADGAFLVIRTAEHKPWEGKDKHAGKPPVKLGWTKS